MYNIIQLNDKDLSELQVIAKELGIKKTDSLKKEDLVYKILDEQAIAGATKKVAADKLKEERKEEQKKKRSRVAPAKKDNKVVSATKEGEAEKAKEAAPAKPQQPSKKEESANKEKETPAVEVKAENTAAPKRKVGRPRKNADAAEQKEVESVKTATPATPKVTEDKVVTEKAPEVIEKAVPAQAPEKKTKANKPAEEKKVVVKPQPQKKAEPVIDEESNILSGADDDDFIPIEDLPSEKIELPTELLENSKPPKLNRHKLLPNNKHHSHNNRLISNNSNNVHALSVRVTTIMAIIMLAIVTITPIIITIITSNVTITKIRTSSVYRCRVLPSQTTRTKIFRYHNSSRNVKLLSVKSLTNSMTSLME